MALFLGASMITCLELIDVVARRCLSACTRRHQPAQHRKRCRRKCSTAAQPQHDANHVHFRSADDVISAAADTAPLPAVLSNHNDGRCRSALKTPSPLQTAVAPCGGRLPNQSAPAAQQRTSLFGRSLLRPSPLAETDIAASHCGVYMHSTDKMMVVQTGATFSGVQKKTW